MDRVILPNHDEKLLDPNYVDTLHHMVIPFLFENDETLPIFLRVSDLYLQSLLTVKAIQHTRRQRYSHANVWTWIKAERPELEARFWHYANTRGPTAASQLIRSEWDKAHPPRAPYRPTGQLTHKQLRAIANARALQTLLAFYSRQHNDGKAA